MKEVGTVSATASQAIAKCAGFRYSGLFKNTVRKIIIHQVRHVWSIPRQ